MPSSVAIPTSQLKAILDKASFVKDAATQAGVSVPTLRNIAARAGLRENYLALAKRGLVATAAKARKARGFTSETSSTVKTINVKRPDTVSLETDVASQIAAARRGKGKRTIRPVSRVSGAAGATTRQPVVNTRPSVPFNGESNITNEDIQAAAAQLRVTGICTQDAIVGALVAIAEILTVEYHKAKSTKSD